MAVQAFLALTWTRLIKGSWAETKVEMLGQQDDTRHNGSIVWSKNVKQQHV